jgi:hypothetical protein
MPPHVLHLLDPTTPEDAADCLALLTAGAEGGGGRHTIAALGHRSTGDLLAAAGRAARAGGRAGPAADGVHWLPSRGWADPTGWRAARRLARIVQPTHIHAWGISAATAAAVAGGDAARIVSLLDAPRPARPRLLRFIHTGRVRPAARAAAPAVWTVPADGLRRGLLAAGVPAADVRLLPAPALPPSPPPPASAEPSADARGAGAGLREQLGLLPQDGPILLAGGHDAGTGHARHDYALWVGAILQQIFPRIRVIVREDPRGRPDPGLERFYNSLPDGDIPVLAPAAAWDDLLALADVFLFTADGPVPAGSLLRAMAAGVPVVGTPVDAVRELVDDRRTGLIAPAIKPRALAACVEEFLSSPTLRTSLTAAARQTAADRHAPATFLHALTSLYTPTAATP